MSKPRVSAPPPRLKSRPEGGLLGRAQASRPSRPGWAAAPPLSASIRVFLSGLPATLPPTACQRLSDPCLNLIVLYALACIFFSLIPLAAFIAHSAQRFAALGPQLLTSPKHCKAPWVGQYSGRKCWGDGQCTAGSLFCSRAHDWGGCSWAGWARTLLRVRAQPVTELRPYQQRQLARTGLLECRGRHG